MLFIGLCSVLFLVFLIAKPVNAVILDNFSTSNSPSFNNYYAGGITDYRGAKFVMRINATLTEVNIESCATEIRLLNGSKSQIANSTVISGRGTFNYNLTQGNSYYLVAGNYGSAYCYNYTIIVSYPYITTRANITATLQSGNDVTDSYNIIKNFTTNIPYDDGIGSNVSYINFISQSPNDITSTNVIGTRLNITYNFTDPIIQNTSILNYQLSYIGSKADGATSYYGTIINTDYLNVTYNLYGSVIYTYSNLSSYGCSLSDFRVKESFERIYCWNGNDFNQLLDPGTINTYAVLGNNTINNSIMLFYNSTAPDVVNGSIYLSNYQAKPEYYSGVNYTFLLSDNKVYPGIYNYIENLVELQSHNSGTLPSQSYYLKMELLGVNISKSYNVFEIMANTTGASQIYYCNETYSSGNPTINSNCVLFGNLNTATFNHTHNPSLNYSQHNIFDLPINSTGFISGIKATSKSIFLIRGTLTGNTQFFYIPNSSRTSNTQTSSNNGATYSDITGTLDAHLHQFNGATDSFSYKACASNLTNWNCSATITDTYNLTLLPPTAPDITSPTNSNYAYNTSFNINYTASSGYTPGVNISSYNISLLNSDLTFNKTINSTATLLSQSFNPVNLSTGTYYIKVEAKDTNNLTAYSISEAFNITSIINIRFKNAYTNVYQNNFTGWIMSSSYNQTFNSGSNNYSTLNILNGAVQVYAEKDNYSITTSNYYNFSLNDTPQTLNLDFSIYSSNSININIKDESTANLINQSILLELQYLNSTYGNYNTSNGLLFIENLPDGEYTLIFSGDLGVNYTSRTYIVSVADRSTQTLNAYLTSSGNSLIIVVMDSYSNAIVEDATISLYRYINNSPVLVEIKNSDITGRAQFSFVPLTKYRFVVQKTNYITKAFDLNPVLYASYDVMLERTIAYIYTGSQEDVKITFSPTQYYANGITNFTMIFSSATGVLNNYGVNISAPCVNYSFLGNNSNGQTFSQNFLLNCSTFRDTLNLSYYYQSVGNSQRNYKAIYFIGGTYSASNYTWINLKDEHFGMGLLERKFTPITMKPQQREVSPPIPRMKTTKVSQNKINGYDVLVRKRGKFERVNVGALEKSQAINFGAFKVGTSASATFKVVPSKLESTQEYKGVSSLKDFYTKNDLFIEKRERRIKSPGELREITFKGVQAQRFKKLF